MEVDRGHAERAMVRLIERSAQAPDPHLFAGLVQACRYCGLLDASVEAHDQARRLDRTLPTTVVHTLWAMGDYERALQDAHGELLGYMLSRGARGFFCVPLFTRDRWIDSLRSHPRYAEIASRADVRHRQASEAFDRAGGARLLRPAMRVS